MSCVQRPCHSCSNSHAMYAAIMTCMQHSCQGCLSQSCHACRFHAMQTAAMTCMQQSCHACKLQLASSQTCLHHSVLASWDLTMHASQAKRTQSLGKWLAVFWHAGKPHVQQNLRLAMWTSLYARAPALYAVTLHASDFHLGLQG